ncbi:MAG: ornithine carbamoyltransferase [Gaiellaceae bacterium]
MPDLVTTLGVRSGLKGRHLLRIADWTVGELELVLDLADELKELQRRREPHRLLEGRTLGLVFDKPSTRTRVSFEAGMAQLGGTALFLPADQLQLARGEPLRDTATVLSRYLDALAVRISSHEDATTLARHASIPVLNALTDAAHPCQALADVITLRERLGDLAGRKVAWVGDGNNVCASFVAAATTFGMNVAVAAPPGYEPPPAALRGGSVELVEEPRDAVAGADAVYTDVWTSMGHEDERARRRVDLARYRIDAELLRAAGKQAIVLHCLPAHEGEEITAEVLYGPQSAVWDQAENRLHVQKALLALVVD